MPRQARLDAPGLLHHIIARGIERRDIFHDKTDYEDFLSRIESSLEKSPNQILAWALMPNHFHLLVRSGGGGLSDLMRRLMTGYAVAYNIRYKRAGHLFQNRYKSIVCEEGPYLLELLRYIHLNPLRAGLVRSLESLARYPYTGHSALMGHIKRPWQKTGDVLELFSSVPATARMKYEGFVAEAKLEKSRPDLVGGGLIRSQGGGEATQSDKDGPHRVSDARVLGSGAFCEKVLTVAGKEPPLREHSQRHVMDVREAARRVAGKWGVDVAALFEKGRTGPVSSAKAALIHAAVDVLGEQIQTMAILTKMSGPAASKARRRGRILVGGEISKLLS